MSDMTPHGRARTAIAKVRYWLPAGASPTVSVGANVAAGDVIAMIPAPPTVVALSNELRLTAAESTRIVESLADTPITDGQIIANHRSGLRKRTVRAPATGMAQALPDSGAILVRPMAADAAVSALHPGTVIAVEHDHMVIATRVYRMGFAFSVGMAWQTAVIPHSTPAAASSSVTAPLSSAGPAHVATIVAYSDNVSPLGASRRGPTAPVIVGTVSDDTAWDLLTGAHEARERGGTTNALVVLDGPGDAAHGERAIRPLLSLAGASIVLDSEAREIILFADEELPARAEDSTDDERGSAAVYLDPERWQEACNIRGTPSIATLATGFRTLVVRTVRGNSSDERTPLCNLEARTDW